MPKILKDPEKNILKIAKYHLLDQGIKTLNMREIAKDAEVSVGTLYNYFPNKDYLVIALIAEFWENFLDKLERQEIDGDTVWITLERMYRRLADTMQVFRLEWLSGEGFQCKDAKREGMLQQEQVRNCILSAIEKQFEKFGITSLEFTGSELARFVFSNWLGMLTYSYLDYTLFERVLKKTTTN